MVIYVKNPKESTRKHLEIINEFRKVSGYKFNIQNLVVFLYSSKKQFKHGVKTILFTIASERIKYLKINFTKEMKSLHTEKL